MRRLKISVKSKSFKKRKSSGPVDTEDETLQIPIKKQKSTKQKKVEPAEPMTEVENIENNSTENKPSDDIPAATEEDNSEPAKLVACDICLDDRADCDHKDKYCTNCFKKHFSEQINGKAKTTSIACIKKDCKKKATPEEVKEIVDDNTYQRFDKLLLNKMLESMDDFRWCANPRCGSGGLGDESAPIMFCSCDTRTCFVCKVYWHDDITCDEFQKMQKSNDRNVFQNWKELNTKDCPNCNVTIQKNGGVNIS